MLSFEKWLLTVAGNAKPIFVGLNAPFDWSFINYYFHRFIGRNPFGFTALDIKINFLRPVPADGQHIVATGTVQHRGKRLAIATSELMHGDVRVAVLTGSTALMPP